MSTPVIGQPPQLSTHGCRLNAYESEAMRQLAEAAGLSDTVIVNSCAVTAEAVRKARQDIRRLRREAPQARIVVTGCAAQIDPAGFAAMAEVDHVVGNTEKMLPDTWSTLARPGPGAADRILVTDIMEARETAGHLIDGFGARSRAHVQIQNGCDHRCTFCVIPYGRGNSRSVPAGVVVEQIRRLVGRGYQEVVLTGVDLTSWGADLPGTPRLGNLVRRILRLVPDLPRLRLSSIDSVEADAELITAFAEEARLAPHLHLSLQSGDDLILKRMKRRHLRADAVAFCADLRAKRPDIVFGADLIAGFPTETEAAFQNSLEIIEACGLTWLHVFPYSPRPGTPAARMPQVSGEVIRERAAQLRAAGALAVERHLVRSVGRRVEVLAEASDLGRAGDFSEVRLQAPLQVGSLAEVQITSHDGRRLVA